MKTSIIVLAIAFFLVSNPAFVQLSAQTPGRAGQVFKDNHQTEFTIRSQGQYFPRHSEIFEKFQYGKPIPHAEDFQGPQIPGTQVLAPGAPLKENDEPFYWSKFSGAQKAEKPSYRLYNPLNDSTHQEWDAHWGYDLFSGYEETTGITYDKEGNIYVIGNDPSCILLKYDISGHEIWRTMYPGFFANAIHVDSAGYIYLGGMTYRPNIGYDNLTTVKYNSNAVLQWVAVFQGAPYFGTSAENVITDRTGNVYVTGLTGGNGTILKHSPEGVQKWAVQTGLPGLGGISASSRNITVDAEGNVYIIGEKNTPGRDYDYAVIKYDSSGNQKWLATYNGPADSRDFPVSIALDSSNNICITGYSDGKSTGTDIATVKFNSEGVLKWVQRLSSSGKRWDAGSSIEADASGNFYVNGYLDVGTSGQNITVKYDSSGVQQWISKVDGSLGSMVRARSGEIYLAFNHNLDYETVKLDQSGAKQWVNYYNRSSVGGDFVKGLTVDDAGNVAVTGMSYAPWTGYDIGTVSYDQAGTQLWAAIYDGLANSGVAHAIAVSPSGNTYLAGSSVSAGYFGTLTALVKYNPSGHEEWLVKYDDLNSPYQGAPNNSPDRTAIGPSGNIYVSGWASGSTVTIKYSPSGFKIWEASTFLSGYNNPMVCGTGFDKHENVYVAGTDYIVVKYAADGTEKWIARYDSTYYYPSASNAMAVDDSGNVYITGGIRLAEGLYGITTLKLNSNGVQKWVARYEPVSPHTGYGTGIALDDSGNIYVTGTSDGDFVTTKYNPAGVEEWLMRYDGPVSMDDVATGITIDPSGNIYVTGNSTGADSTSDYATIKYSRLGIQEWVKRYSGPGKSQDGAVAITADNGGVFVTGTSAPPGSPRDIVTIKYDPSGTEEWVMPYDGPGGADDLPAGISRDASSNIYVGGTSYIPPTSTSIGGPVFTLIKYRQLPLFELSESSLSYGPVDVSCVSTRNIIIRNPGAGVLNISSIVSDDVDFTPAFPYAVVLSKDSLILQVRFAPLSIGAKSGSIIITHDGPGSPDTVYLNGTGSGDGTELSVHNKLSKGWQLISLPFDVRCPYVLPVLFEYDNGYLHNDTMSGGKAYWKKFERETDLYMAGLPMGTDTFDIRSGWNLIGSESVPVPAGSVSTMPGEITSFIYGYDGGYSIADTIQPGLGYWMKASEAGKLIMHSGTANRPKVNSGANESNMIKFTDALGRVQKLYFAQSGIAGVEWYELPPAAPQGGFDVRFLSGRMLEVVALSGEYPLKISEAQYPVTVSWEIKTGSGVYVFSTAGGKVAMEGSGSVKIDEKQGGKIAIKVMGPKGLPKEYALRQNYPNPFNPSTVIRYELPEESRVELRIYDLLGQEVKTVADEVQGAGYRSAAWDGTNKSGQAVSSGVYFFRLQAADKSQGGIRFMQVRKMLLVH